MLWSSLCRDGGFVGSRCRLQGGDVAGAMEFCSPCSFLVAATLFYRCGAPRGVPALDRPVRQLRDLFSFGRRRLRFKGVGPPGPRYGDFPAATSFKECPAQSAMDVEWRQRRSTGPLGRLELVGSLGTMLQFPFFTRVFVLLDSLID